MVSLSELRRVPFTSRPVEEQVSIIRAGRFLPKPPEHDDEGRLLLFKFIQFEWLTAEQRSRLFCWPCLLSIDSDGGKDQWTQDGVTPSDLVPETIEAHQELDQHRKAVKWLEGRKKKVTEPPCTVGFVFDSNPRDDRYILEAHLVHLQYYLKNGPPLQGYIEYLDSGNVGLPRFYRSFFEVFPELKEPYRARVGVFANRLNLNEYLCQSIVDVMKDAIREEVQHVQYVSVIIEDISIMPGKQDLATTLRYVHLNGQLTDRLIGFAENHDMILTGGEMVEYLVKVVNEFGLEQKLVAVSMNSPAFTNGELENFISSMQSTYPRVLFTDPSRLSRHLLDRLYYVIENDRWMHIFHRTLLGYELSLQWKRKAFATHLGITVDKLRQLTLPSLCTFILQNRMKFVEFFQYWYNLSGGEREFLTRFYQYLQDFAPMLMLPMFAFILKRVETLEDKIRKHFTDWPTCVRLIDVFAADLIKFKRDNFDKLYNEAAKEATKGFKSFVLNPIPYEDFHWSNDDFNFDHAPVRQKFSTVLDTFIILSPVLVKQFRFEPMKKLHFFNLLHPFKFEEYTRVFPKELIKSLKKAFPKEFDLDRLRMELEYLYRENCDKPPPVDVFLQWFTTRQLSDCFPETTKLACLVVTIPTRIFPSASQPRVTSRQHILEEYRNTLVPNEVPRVPEYYIRSEWRLFFSLVQSSRSFHTSVVNRFFTVITEEEANSYEETPDMDYRSDLSEDEEWTNDEDDEQFASYIEKLTKADELYYPYQNQEHQLNQLCQTDNPSHKPFPEYNNFDTRYVRLVGLDRPYAMLEHHDSYDELEGFEQPQFKEFIRLMGDINNEEEQIMQNSNKN